MTAWLPRVARYDSLDALPPAVRRAFSHPAQPDFLRSLDWFECLYRTALATAVEPLIYVVYDRADTPLAMLCGGRTHAQRRVLASLTNYYTTEFSVALSPAAGELPPIAEALARCVGAELPRWHMVELRYLKDDDPFAAAFHAALDRTGFAVTTYDQYENWQLALDATTFDAYYARRSSQLRNTIARREKKARKTYRIETRLVQDPLHDLDRCVADFVQIYNASWKEPEPYAEFIPALIRSAAARRVLRLGLLYADGVPAAAQLWLTSNGRAVIYKLAYDEKFKDFSPGSILSCELFRHAIDVDRVALIDYGVGNEGYKRDWMESARRVFGMRAYNRATLRGRFMESRDTLRRALRRWLARGAAAAPAGSAESTTTAGGPK